MKQYLIMKVIKHNNTTRINYHSKCSVSESLERSWDYAFTDYNECENKMCELEHYDKPYLEKGFKFEYIIFEREAN